MAIIDKSFIYLHIDFLRVFYGDNYVNHSISGLVKKYFGGAKKDFPFDRTGTIVGPLKETNISPIPEFDINFNKSFKEISENAAKDILNEGKQVDIFWSGGVDSTSIVVSFLNVCKDLTQLNIIFEKRSIDEYPLFYNNYIKHLNYTQLETYIYKNLSLEDHSVVTGHPGGLLVGQWGALKILLKNLGFIEDDLTQISWKEVFNTKTTVFGSKELDNIFASKIAPQLEKAPFKIESICDLQWWLGFSMKWQGENISSMRYHTTLNHEKVQNFKPFFSTDEFQQWAMWNYYTNIRKICPSYKQDFKQIIYDFTKDEEYYIHKQKVNSGAPRLSENGKVLRPHTDAIDNNYNTFTIKDVKSSNTYRENILNNYGNCTDDWKQWLLLN